MAILDLADFLEEVGESNEEHNAKQRRTIADMGVGSWLGKINLYNDDDRAQIMWAWDGGIVYTFGPSFVVPKYDAELEQMIRDRDASPYTGTRDDAVLVDAIFDRLYALGGKSLIWS